MKDTINSLLYQSVHFLSTVEMQIIMADTWENNILENINYSDSGPSETSSKAIQMFNQIILISEALMCIQYFSTPVSSLPANNFLHPEWQIGQMPPAQKVNLLLSWITS